MPLLLLEFKANLLQEFLQLFSSCSVYVGSDAECQTVVLWSPDL